MSVTALHSRDVAGLRAINASMFETLLRAERKLSAGGSAVEVLAILRPAIKAAIPWAQPGRPTAGEGDAS